MKKLLALLPLVLLLSGCAAQETFETIADEPVQSAMAQVRSISVQLPDDAVAPVLEQNFEQVYLSENYEIILETLDSGDLDASIRHLSGYGREDLTVLKTRRDDADCYEFVWAAAGERGDRLGRAVILDDGNYHYCLTAIRDAEVSQIQWDAVFSSFRLS